MRLNKKKLTKFFIIFVISIFSVFALIFLALYNDSSRNFIVNRAVSYLQNDNFFLKFEGINKDLTYIEKISVKFSNNLIDVFQIGLKKEGIISRPQIEIRKIIFRSSNEDSNKNVENNDFNLSKIISHVKKVKLLVKSLHVSEIELANTGHKYICRNLTYKSNSEQDRIFFEKDESKLDIVANWNNTGSIEGKFYDIFGFSGSLHMNSLRKSNPQYQITVKNSDYLLSAKGSVIDKLQNILISQASLKCNNKHLDFHGKVYTKEKKVNLITKLSLDNFIDTNQIPSEITKNFQNISTNISIQKTKKGIYSLIDFQKENRNLGNSIINLEGHNLSINFNIPWIDFWGYKLKSFDLQSEDLKNFKTNILGEDFKISSDIVHNKKVNIKKLVCNFKKGSIVSEKSFIIDNSGIGSSFKFNFENFDFFKKFYNLEGQASGKIFIKGGICNIDATVDRAVNKNFEIYNGKIFGNLNKLKINIANAKYLDNMLKDVTFEKNKERLSLKSKLGNNSNVILNGSIRDNTLNISGNIKNKKMSLNLNGINLNFKNRIYKIPLEITDTKKFGKLVLSITPSNIDISAKNFSLKSLGQVLDQNIPECLVTGSMDLTPHKNLFCGTGRFNLKTALARNNTLNVDLNQSPKGLSIQGGLINATDNLHLNCVVPFFVDRNLNYSINNSFPITILVNGNVHIENLFKFPDGLILKGEIKPDLNIKGSIEHPRIQGKVEWLNAAVIASDIVLKNGTITFLGNENKLLVNTANFSDAYGKKVNISGDITLFASNGNPNIDTNLLLNFDNFRLFDADTMKINVTGSGRMTGSLDNMKLSGNIKIPLCELMFSENDDENKYKDIVVVNDLFLNEKEKEENDFFSYDLNLECPNIDIIGDIYKLQFNGNLHLGSYKRKATLSGNIDLKKGKLNLFGKRMIFQKGKLEFFENHPFDPKMKLTCSRDINAIRVILEVKNDPGKDMSLNLYSQPHYTQDVILSQMMFGKSSKDISIAEAAQLAHAINSMNQQGYIFSVLNTFQNIGLVDSISFSMDNNSSSLYKNSQSSTNNKLKVKAGKYISDNVYISVNQKEEYPSLDVDLSIGSNTSLKVNSLGEVGISWKFRY